MQLVQGVNVGEEQGECVLGHRVLLGDLVPEPLGSTRLASWCVFRFKVFHQEDPIKMGNFNGGFRD